MFIKKLIEVNDKKSAQHIQKELIMLIIKVNILQTKFLEQYLQRKSSKFKAKNFKILKKFRNGLELLYLSANLTVF